VTFSNVALEVMFASLRSEFIVRGTVTNPVAVVSYAIQLLLFRDVRWHDCTE